VSGTDGVAEYYATVAPFYGAEMAIRDDLPQWRRVVALAAARTALDLGCGDGRLARALASHVRTIGLDVLTALLPAERDFAFVQGDMRALPFGDRGFDLAMAANDPFAHLLTDEDRTTALDEASRVARRTVIDGLSLARAEQESARNGELVRRATLAGGTERQETWEALGDDRYRATYRYFRGGALLAEATSVVRAWSPGERALRGRQHRIAGGLDGRPHDRSARGFVLVIGESLWT
jgi:SAM-dependent methyltransferase